MDSVKLTSASASMPVLAPPRAAPADRRGDGVASRSFDGLRWTYRDGFERILAHAAPAAWCEPEKSGWRRIKHNAAREVWRATLDGRAFYLKYFHCAQWTARLKALVRGASAQTEWNSGLYALRYGIHAVQPAGCALHLAGSRHDCSLLVTQAVEPAYPLADFWQTLQSDDAAERRWQDAVALIDSLAELIAHAHQAGFEHLDMHAANILVQPLAPRRYQALLVDLQSARRGAAVSDRAVVRNLAQLNQWFRRHSTVGDRLRFLRAYLRWRNEHEHAFRYGRSLELSFDELVEALIGAAERHATALWARRDRRIEHAGRYFGRLALPGGWRGTAVLRCKHPSPDSPASRLELPIEWWRAQLVDPTRFFAPGAAHACKDSHSAQVCRVVLRTPDGAALPLIVKRPLARNWRRRLRHTLALSRSRRGWRIANALLHRDLPTARPLAMLERRVGSFVRDSVLITEFVPDAVDLRTYVNAILERGKPRQWAARKRELCALLVRQLRRLFERGFHHRDCKADNILIVEGPPLRMLWIDVDGVKRVGRAARRPTTHHGADRRAFWPLARLYVSLRDLPQLTRADFTRALQAYFARFGAAPDVWRDAWRDIAALVDRKIRQTRRRRDWKIARYGRA